MSSSLGVSLIVLATTVGLVGGPGALGRSPPAAAANKAAESRPQAMAVAAAPASVSGAQLDVLIAAALAALGMAAHNNRNRRD